MVNRSSLSGASAPVSFHVDPLLLEWLPDLTVLDLPVGNADSISDSGAMAWTQFEVLQGDPRAVERRSLGAQFEQAGPA
jgi:hypothetical protein